MASKGEVRNAAASLLRRRRLGQAIDPSVKDELDVAYDSVYAQLKEQRLAIWTSDANATIPSALTYALGALVAMEASGSFGLSERAFQRIEKAVEEAWPKIRMYVRKNYESLDEPTDY